MSRHEIKRIDLITILDEAKGKTLGEVDVKKVFDKTILNQKVTGIAGDVIEQSVLGYSADNKQKPDLVVDGIDTELKTTGLKRTKKQTNSDEFEIDAKEPMTITAVSPDNIVCEEFENSALWHKLEHMLLVYYLYDSEKTVQASEYAGFPILDYQFHKFEGDEKEILQKDWELVRDFIRTAKKELENPASRYHEISKLRENMLFIDTAPKYPNAPRFRLRRPVVSAIVKKHFGKDFKQSYNYTKFNSYDELNNILHTFSLKNKGKSIKQIADDLGFEIKRNIKGVVNKSITERVLTAAFGATSQKLRKIEIFAKIGIIPKTIAISSKGARTEDTKLDAIDFSEWTDMDISFEESSVYDFFANHVMLFSVFQEPYSSAALEDNIFLGFKRISFDDEFIYEHVKPTWDKVRELVNNNVLMVSEARTKYGKFRFNKSGTQMEATNLPKSKDYVVFLRGSGKDSTKKPYTLNGFQIYQQNFWIKGKVLVQMLSEIDYI
jgi:DNA mismatch repair protein MutH